MASVSPLSAIGTTPESHPALKRVPAPSQRRDKSQLSCNWCRGKKLKCDRNKPCEGCSRRGLALSCTYVPSVMNTSLKQNRPTRNSSGASVQKRIDHLEGLVVSLVDALNATKQIGQQTKCDPDIDLSTPSHMLVLGERAVANSAETNSQAHVAQLSDNFGRISLENAETSYVGSAHWIAILDGITELKDHFEDNESQVDQYVLDIDHEETDGPELLFGRNKYATKHEILAFLPPRPVVDRLVSRYFNAMDMAPVVVHGPTFLTEYAQFWQNPLGTPVMWVGLLYTMICLATQFQQVSEDIFEETPLTSGLFQDPHYRIQAYREKIVQCLILGKYTKSVPYTIETLVLYFTVEHFRYKDTQIGVWILLGIIVRIAMRLGYHRDPLHSPRISSFHGEMRRRVWAIIVQLDLITSFQIGLPRMVREGQSDTLEPHNLLDNDFNSDMVNLPPSRPDTDMTPILYVVVKNRMVSVFGVITDFTTSTRPSPYTEVMKLDKILCDSRSAVPSGLQMRSLNDSITDHPDVIMRRIYLDLIFQKSRCVLHRKYLIPARLDSQYNYSRQSCIDAALQILQHQSTFYQETQAGGQLHQYKWKVSSLVNHDFLLAVTILCLELDHDLGKESVSQLGDEMLDPRKRDTLMLALCESCGIWHQSSGSSREAHKAAEAIEIVLEKVEKTGIDKLAGNKDKLSDLFAVRDSPVAHYLEAPNCQPHLESAAQNKSNFSIPMDNRLFSAATSSQTHVSAAVPNFDNTNSCPYLENDFDWEHWDAQFQGQNSEDPSSMSNDMRIFDTTFSKTL